MMEVVRVHGDHYKCLTTEIDLKSLERVLIKHGLIMETSSYTY